MDKKNNRTHMAKREDRKVQWLLIDAEGKTLGRLASEITKVLRGKHRPDYTPHADTGDGVVVINAEKVHVTGNKEAQKVYRRHTGFQSGMRETTYEVMLQKKPTHILDHAVRGMMPRNRLCRAQLKRLRIFAGSEHGMEAQTPVAVNC